MKENKETYRHFIPDIDIAVERYTNNVPGDGKYYILKAGKIIQSFRSLKQAEENFKKLLTETGFKPKPLQNEKVKPLDDSIERYMSAKAIFWAEGPLAKYRSKRGKGGRGGRGGV